MKRLKYVTKNKKSFYGLKKFKGNLNLEKALVKARIKKEGNPIILAAAESGRIYPISLVNVVEIELE